MTRKISCFIIVMLGVALLIAVPSGQSWAQSPSTPTPVRPLIDLLHLPADSQPDLDHHLYLPMIFKDLRDYNPPPPPNLPLAEISDTFSARAEADLGKWGPFGDEWVFTRSQIWTDIRSYPRKVAANFVAEADDTRIAIFFSAEAYVDGPTRRMFVRVLIDGETSHPADIVLTRGTTSPESEARSFIFTDVVDSGLHTVEIQWLVDEGATGYMRNAALLIRQSSGHTIGEPTLEIVTPPSGHNLTHDQAAWVDIPGLSGSVYAEAGDTLLASISAESLVSQDGVLLVRALVDGAPALPGDVIFTRNVRPQARSMTFGLQNVTEGVHNVRFQWFVTDGDQATLGDRTMVLATGQPINPEQAQVFVVAPNGPAISTFSTDYSLVSGMQAAGPIPANAEVVVIFSAETGLPASASLPAASLFVRLTINGQVVAASEVQLAHSDQSMGVQSFVFDAKHINASQAAIQVEWRSGNGQMVIMGDRSMAVLVKPGAVPDLAEPPKIGLGNVGIEPVIGPRNVLTVLWDPHRPNMPAPTLSTLENMLFGASDSVSDYYHRVSDGKFSLQNAGVLGPYDAEEDWQHYWQSPYAACNSPSTTGYTGGHQRKWAEALTAAGANLDFSAFDANGDGVLDPSEELAILIVIPQDTEDGFVRMLDPYCSGAPFTVDGVIIPVISEWYALAQNGNFTVPTHELAHLILLLGDMYNVNFNIATEAGRLALMEQFNPPSTPHIVGPSKLALGWVDRQIITQDSAVTLEDVKHSHDVIVLPRLNGGGGKEYFLLENRRTSIGDPLYDEQILDDGIAVWHVVEDSTANGALPNCVPPNLWNMIGADNPRRGIRLIRPTAAFNNTNALWDAMDYDLLDTGLVCPPGNPHNVLEWADGIPSGYNILNFSSAGQVMSFELIAP